MTIWREMIGKPPIGGFCEQCGHFAGRHHQLTCLWPTRPCPCTGLTWQGKRWTVPDHGEPTMTSKDLILGTVDDLVTSFLWDDRKEDEELPRGQIEAAIATGEIYLEEIVAQFRTSLTDGLESSLTQASSSSSAPVPVPLPSGPQRTQDQTPHATTDDQPHTGTPRHPSTDSDPSSPPCHHTQDTYPKDKPNG